VNIRARSASARALMIAILLAGTASQATAQTPAKPGAKANTALTDAQFDGLFAKAEKSQAMLRVLVQAMPKGGDLHNHGGGNIYAEDFITWGAEKGACYNTVTQAVVAGPCTAPLVPLNTLADTNSDLYSDVVDALSTRRFDQHVGDPTISGHRRFFRSFSRTGPGGRGDPGRSTATALEHASEDNSVYLELMQGPNAGRNVTQASVAEPWNEADMEGRLSRLQPLVQQALPMAKQDTDASEAGARKYMACDTPAPKRGCEVTVRYLMSMSRENKPEYVFGQMAFAFALVGSDPRYVGVNIVQPEDGAVSTRDYHLHMRMFKFFHAKYPNVQMTLHAGELALGLVEPRDLKFHIREAVEAGAKRIGHGVDIAYEDNAAELLQRMARDKIDVEINLTSNDVILGVKGAQHPLALYMAAGVPVTLSTDDAGVSRIDLSNEYVRAVTEQGLSYTQLRKITRDSLTYSFLAGPSLWDASGMKLSGPCLAVVEKPTGACAAFLKTSDKAREQWRLELKLKAYEAGLPKVFAAIQPDKFPAGIKH
jgi:adenosine deaminase